MRDLRLWRLSTVCAFLLSLVAPLDAANHRLFHASSATPTTWTAADLDGDRKVDLARPGAFRAESGGFVQELHFRFASAQRSIVTVRVSAVAQRVRFRDLDGDADRDLVLEGMDRRPIAVLLNDGGGQFHQANLEDFRAQLPNPERRSWHAAEHATFTPDDGCAPGAAAVASLAVRTFELRRLGHLPVSAVVLLARTSSSANRGPPTVF